MSNSADIRKENKKMIYRFMLNGKQYTKQQVALGIGLSVATCNTLLNDMQAQGIVLGGQKQPGEIGRSAVLYQIKEDHESYLAIHFDVEHGDKFVETILFSATGRILFREKRMYSVVDYEQIERIIGDIVKCHSNLVQIIVGTPSVAEHGVIKYCDIPELDDVPLKENLERKFGLRTSIENDMFYKAYGYYKKNSDCDSVITLAYFPSHLLPCTATIHKGTVVKGTNGLAGLTGFLPYGISKQELLNRLEPHTCIPFVEKSISAIIVLLNPGKIVLTGDLIDKTTLEIIQTQCKTSIPEEYMPEFLIEDSFDEYYYEGMYQIAVDKKEC